MRRSSAFLALPVVFAFACSDQPTALKEALPAPEFSSIAGSAASSYLIIANGRRLPQSLARNVQAAGGVTHRWGAQGASRRKKTKTASLGKVDAPVAAFTQIIIVEMAVFIARPSMSWPTFLVVL